jgi:hypothetical protein
LSPPTGFAADASRRSIEQRFESNLQAHPPTTSSDLSVGAPIRVDPTPTQWALINTLHPGIDIGFTLDRIPASLTTRIAIIDESFDLKAPGLMHAFDVDAAINLLQPGAPLHTAHRNSFHHGNMVASIIANRPVGQRNPAGVLASTNISIIPIVAAGGTGPAWRTPRATPKTILAGLRHAVESGAQIINISAGVAIDADQLQRLSQDPIWSRLEDAGIPVVCAAGNEGLDIDVHPVFPASIDRPNIIAVMAIGPNGALATRIDSDHRTQPGTNTGLRTIDVAAPGEVIEVLARPDRPQLVDGTSAAAAFVTAAMAIDPTIRAHSTATLKPHCRLGGFLRLK